MIARPRCRMPRFVREALEAEGLMEDYRARPAYQRNDYLGWILRAKRPETGHRRLRRMLDELCAGGVYMGMEHRPSRRSDAT